MKFHFAPSRLRGKIIFNSNSVLSNSSAILSNSPKNYPRVYLDNLFLAQYSQEKYRKPKLRWKLFIHFLFPMLFLFIFVA